MTKEPPFIQIRLTQDRESEGWAWSIFRYSIGDYVLDHNPTAGGYAFVHETAEDAFNFARHWVKNTYS